MNCIIWGLIIFYVRIPLRSFWPSSARSAANANSSVSRWMSLSLTMSITSTFDNRFRFVTESVSGWCSRIECGRIRTFRFFPFSQLRLVSLRCFPRCSRLQIGVPRAMLRLGIFFQYILVSWQIIVVAIAKMCTNSKTIS